MEEIGKRLGIVGNCVGRFWKRWEVVEGWGGGEGWGVIATNALRLMCAYIAIFGNVKYI